jgi:hypothetical protein
MSTAGGAITLEESGDSFTNKTVMAPLGERGHYW